MSGTGAEAVHRTAREAGGAVGWGVVLKALRFAFALATGIIIRRVLGPELVGQYGLVQLTLEVAGAVASVGMKARSGIEVHRCAATGRTGVGVDADRLLLPRQVGQSFSVTAIGFGS